MTKETKKDRIIERLEAEKRIFAVEAYNTLSSVMRHDQHLNLVTVRELGNTCISLIDRKRELERVIERLNSEILGLRDKNGMQ